MIQRFQYQKMFVTEFLGTLTLVVAGAGAVALTTLIQIPDGLALVALVFGVTVSTVGVTLRRFSCAHINPAVTVAHGLAGKSSPKLFFPIVLFQVLGGITGGIILSFFFPKSEASNYLGSTLLASTVPPWTGTTLEAAGTFVLSIMILAPLRRLGTKANSTLVGLTLFILIFILGPFTSASLNPARSIGPALVSGHLENLEVYIVGPLSGGLVAGLISRRSRIR